MQSEHKRTTNRSAGDVMADNDQYPMSPAMIEKLVTLEANLANLTTQVGEARAEIITAREMASDFKILADAVNKMARSIEGMEDRISQVQKSPTRDELREMVRGIVASEVAKTVADEMEKVENKRIADSARETKATAWKTIVGVVVAAIAGAALTYFLK